MIASPGSLRSRLFRAFALVTVIAAVLPALFSRSTLYDDRLELAATHALLQAKFAKAMLDPNPDATQIDLLFNEAEKLSMRMTLTDASGRVLQDSHIGEGGLPDLDNHGDRPEIEEALTNGSGLSLRHSNSLGLEAAYAAVRLKSGGVVRIAIPLADIRRSLSVEMWHTAVAIAGVAGFCLLLSVLITAKIRRGLDSMAEVVSSIAADSGNRRLRAVPGREFLPLAYAVNHMADTIEKQVAETSDQRGQLECILDSMHEGVLVLGPSGSIRRWNRALSDMFPELPRAEGKPLIEGLPVPAMQRKVDALFSAGDDKLGAAFATDNMDADGSVHFELPAGRFFVAHLSRPVSCTASLGAVIVVYDATELLRLERVRRDFVANVSHELRTPLTAIAGYAETLAGSVDIGPEYRSFAGIIQKHAAGLARVISDLLALARIEDTRERIALSPMDPGEALRQGMEACRELATAKDVCFAVSFAPGQVLANAPLLAQVFRNLLENACRYSPDNGEVLVTAEAGGENMLFTVADSGPGIPAPDLPRIFERFYQVEKERNSGTAGVGLAICKHIIERHGGRIWAKSPFNGAATAMRFTLPLA